MLQLIRETLAWLNANKETVWPILVGLIAIIAMGAFLWAWGERRNAKRLQAESDEIKENSQRQFKRMQSRMRNAGGHIKNAIVSEFALLPQPTDIDGSYVTLEKGMRLSRWEDDRCFFVSVCKNRHTVVDIQIYVDNRGPTIRVQYNDKETAQYGLEEKNLPKTIEQILAHIRATKELIMVC